MWGMGLRRIGLENIEQFHQLGNGDVQVVLLAHRTADVCDSIVRGFHQLVNAVFCHNSVCWRCNLESSQHHAPQPLQPAMRALDGICVPVQSHLGRRLEEHKNTSCVRPVLSHHIIWVDTVSF